MAHARIGQDMTVMPTTRSRRGTKPRARRRYWSHTVKTVSTYPPKGLFSKDAKTIARYINRAGHNLSRGRILSIP